MQPVRRVPPQLSDVKASLEPKKRTEAIRGFEEMFVSRMLKAMRQTVPEAGESRAKALWREQFDAEIARRIAEGGGIGLAPLLEKGVPGAAGERGRKP